MDEKLIIEKVLEIFNKKGYKGYDDTDIENMSVRKSEKEELRDGSIKDVYVVSFWSKPLFGERKLIFANIDVETLDLLYMGGPSGYIEI
ncbi:hypothetical protein [Flavobacterium sp.]|uniref:hypothetical protein n=1 Tax=Flavobacterium sp. TaxID=239 RepID=UPI003D6B448C